MKKIVKLTETDLSRIVKKIINENRGVPNLDSNADNFRHWSKKILYTMDDYSELMKKGEYTKMTDEIELLKRNINQLEYVLSEIKQTIGM